MGKESRGKETNNYWWETHFLPLEKNKKKRWVFSTSSVSFVRCAYLFSFTWKLRKPLGKCVTTLVPIHPSTNVTTPSAYSIPKENKEGKSTERICETWRNNLQSFVKRWKEKVNLFLIHDKSFMGNLSVFLLWKSEEWVRMEVSHLVQWHLSVMTDMNCDYVFGTPFSPCYIFPLRE